MCKKEEDLNTSFNISFFNIYDPSHSQMMSSFTCIIDENHTFKAAAPRANQPSGNKEFIAIADSLIYNQIKNSLLKISNTGKIRYHICTDKQIKSLLNSYHKVFAIS